MRRFAILLALLLTIPVFAQTSADDAPASREDIEKYLTVMHSREMVRQVSEAMVKPMRQMMHEQSLKDKDKLPADFEEHMNSFLEKEMNSLPFDAMIDAMIPVYQKHLTKGDVGALIAFYSTGTGQKLLREMPLMMSEAMQSTVPIMRKQMEGMQERVRTEVAAMTEKSHTSPKAN